MSDTIQCFAQAVEIAEVAGTGVTLKADEAVEIKNELDSLRQQLHQELPMIGITNSQIRQFAATNGYLEVWRSWRDHMLAQGRDVPEKRMRMETLPENDVQLDTEIAFDVIRDFVVWYNDHLAEAKAEGIQ